MNANHPSDSKGRQTLRDHDMTRCDKTRARPATETGNYVREVTARYIGPRRKGLTISGPGDAACLGRTLAGRGERAFPRST